MTDFKLKYQIVADAAKAKAEVKSFDDLLRNSGASIGSAFAGPAATAAVGVAAIGTAAVGAGVALFELTKTAAEYGSAIFDASKKTGSARGGAVRDGFRGEAIRNVARGDHRRHREVCENSR
jgi:hypothetical protein